MASFGHSGRQAPQLIHSAVISSAMTLASFFSTKIDEYVAPKGTGWSSAIIAAVISSMIQAGWDLSQDTVGSCVRRTKVTTDLRFVSSQVAGGAGRVK